MRIRSTRPNDPAAADAARLNAGADHGSSSVGRSATHVAPARVTVGLPGLMNRTRTVGPKRARVAQPASENVATYGKAMSAGRHEATLRGAHQGMDEMYAVARPETGQPVVPRSFDGMGSDAGLRSAVGEMFGPGAASDALVEAMLSAVPPQTDGPSRYLPPLVLATAFHSIGITDPGQARQMLEGARHGGVSSDLFRLERVLAATPVGTHVLAHVRGLQDEPRQVEALRDGLKLCSELERKGVRLDRHASVGEVVRDLERTPESKIDSPLGHDDDSPIQLLAQATRYAHVLRSDPWDPAPHQADDHAAYVAWKKGGFTESGKGSDFNKAIGRLHKFMTYADRADHGDRSLRGIARDVKNLFGRAVGVGKSPLTSMRHGALGGDMQLAHEEAAKLRIRLEGVLGTAVDTLVDELRDPAVRANDGARYARQARAAVFDLWRETGRTDHSAAAIFERAGRLMADAGAPMLPLDEKAMVRSLRAFTRRARAEDGSPVFRIGVRALEDMGAAGQRRRGAPLAADPQAVRDEIARLRTQSPRTKAQQARLDELQALRRREVGSLVSELRAMERGGDDARPLFRFSDIKAILRGTPREGPTPADAQRVMQALAHAKYISAATFSDGASRGLGTFGALGLRVGSVLGTPLAYPVAQVEAGRSATISVGNFATGGRLFVGTEVSKSGTVGVGAGWVAPPLVGGAVSALAVGQATASHGRSHVEGLSISARNDLPGWEDKLPQVIDFMFEQSSLKPGEGRAEKPADLWARFARRFGSDPHVGVNWVDERSASTSASIGATVLARATVGPTTQVGPGLSVGAAVSDSRFRRSVNAEGADVPTTLRARQVSASASASVSQTSPFVSIPSETPVAGWGAGMPLVGASMEWQIAGGLAIARLGRTSEGTLSPALCQREILFRDVATMNEYINRNRETWERAIVAQDPTGTTTTQEAKERLNAFTQELASVQSPLSLHGEFVTLDSQVADRINACEARLATLLGHGDRQASGRPLPAAVQAECNALQNEVSRLLKAESSWMPVALYSAEQNAVNTTTGINFGVRVANQEVANAFHVNAVLIPGVAKGA